MKIAAPWILQIFFTLDVWASPSAPVTFRANRQRLQALLGRGETAHVNSIASQRCLERLFNLKANQLRLVCPEKIVDIRYDKSDQENHQPYHEHYLYQGKTTFIRK